MQKLQDKAEQEATASMAADRKSQVGTGDRSERIRTYKLPTRPRKQIIVSI